MQRRPFGKTELMTSILGFGGFHLLEISTELAGRLLNRYLDAGGNYIESAASYGNGVSEQKIGKAVARRRDEYVLVSKTAKRDREGAAAEMDRSLTTLRTDHLDCVLMHGVSSMADLDSILAPGGAMEAALAARDAGKVRLIGLSMHGHPGTLLAALERWPFDAVMTTINYYDRFNFPEIEERLLPLAAEKGTAVILMKPLADGYLYKSVEPAFRYAFSRPVSVVVTGVNSEKMLEDDLRCAEAFEPMTAAQEEALFREAVELGDYVCRQCGKCVCPKGIDIPAVFLCEGRFDRQMMRGTVDHVAEYALSERLRFWFGNQAMAREAYDRLEARGDRCDGCGACLKQCPYGIDIPAKMNLSHRKLTGQSL